MCFHSDFCTVIVLGQIDSEIGGTFVSRCWHSRDIPIYYVIGSRRAVGFFCVIAPQKCVGKLLANGDDMCDTVRIQIVEVNPAADGNRFSNGQTDAYSCFFRCDGVLVPRDGSCPHIASGKAFPVYFRSGCCQSTAANVGQFTAIQKAAQAVPARCVDVQADRAFRWMNIFGVLSFHAGLLIPIVDRRIDILQRFL